MGCRKSFVCVENLKIYVCMYMGERLFVCEFKGCDKWFVNLSDCCKYIYVYILEKLYWCKYIGCDKSYIYFSFLRKYMKVYGLRFEEYFKMVYGIVLGSLLGLFW